MKSPIHTTVKTNRTYLGLGIFAIVTVVIAACTGSATAKLNLLFKDGGAAGVAAKVGDQNITNEELNADVQFEIYDLEKKIFDIRKNALKRALEKKLIGAEAEKAKMSLEDYIQKNVIKSEPKVSEAEVKAFAKERGVPDANLNDQIKSRIQQILGEQKKEQIIEAYLAKLTKSNPVEVYFKKPKLNITVNAEGSPFTGAEDAKVTMYEFSDFECPFCSRGAKVVSEVKKKYGNKVKIIFKHLPLPMHPNAKPASEVSMCIWEQDKAKFWKYHDLVFDKQKDGLTMEKLMAHAKSVGAKEDKLKECLDSKKYVEFIESDLKIADQIGIRSTPTFIINGQAVSGAQGIDVFSEIIDEELN